MRLPTVKKQKKTKQTPTSFTATFEQSNGPGNNTVSVSVVTAAISQVSQHQPSTVPLLHLIYLHEQ